ncbi:DVU_1553 family AMP-dependent CoA ligase [Petroclostridium sp. X23]|uniref:DVU_1553 family AMP-dependent CoA ligase n=1 Tax=Petroclostridium sp. X23 TaxID=3045146 RepID=UPI0024AE0AF5|nr:AMP-binding protein [Petroclostridium sp. X23]WHH58652.1 AMP-binding protein [Petroclostridium sp. X23]
MKLTPLEHWIMNKSGIKERDRNALEAYQLNKIKEMIHYAKKNCLFYSGQLRDIDADEIQYLEDLQRIPFTIPNQIKENPLSFLCVPLRDIKRIVTLNSSGTSGEEKRIYFTEEDLGLTVDFFKHGMDCLADETDKVLVLLPGKAYGSIGDLLKKALAMSKIECFVQGVLNDPEETARCIAQNNITCIVGIPMQVLYFSRIKADVFKRNIKKVLLSTDYVPEVLIRELTVQHGCRVFTHYGMTEMGYGGGVECEALDGYHMREADLYFEIVHPETGQVLPDGQWGEVVFTTLTRQAMPLIRYKTGDIGSFSSTSCACGTFLKAMRRVLGRIDNKVCITENQCIYLRELDETVLSFKEVMDYRAYISDGNSLIIELAARNNAAFRMIEGEVVRNIEDALYKKSGYKISVKVLEKQDNNSHKITNSMIKRKIYDCRGS